MPPTTVRVLARKAFTHDGRAFVAGTYVDLSPVDASVLSRRGLINLSIPSKQARAEIESRQLTAEKPTTRRRNRPTTRAGRQSYRTRNMTAEGTTDK